MPTVISPKKTHRRSDHSPVLMASRQGGAQGAFAALPRLQLMVLHRSPPSPIHLFSAYRLSPHYVPDTARSWEGVGRKLTKHLARGLVLKQRWAERKTNRKLNTFIECVRTMILKSSVQKPVYFFQSAFYSRQCQIAIEVSKCLLSMSVLTPTPAADHTV